ncbi:DUF6088 family protein [Sphingomonas silueang]|uniref:DUF6088 family protein n=1 Tax=Sphingomonas silueang TaxID=3156617 RepID=UPI0032B3BD3B
MTSEPLAEQIMHLARTLPEGEPLYAKQLLGLGSRAGVDQALSRLARTGALLRIGRGLYVRPIESRFGTRAPETEKLVEALAEARGETVASHGAAAANALGLTTQVPTRSIYLTSGRSRTLTLGKLKVELQHVPSWQLTLAGRPGGEIVRALAWLGPERACELSPLLKLKAQRSAIEEVARARIRLPEWMARQVSELAA